MWLYVWMDRPVYPEEEMDEENVVEDESELTLNKMEDDIAVVRTSACHVCGCGCVRVCVCACVEGDDFAVVRTFAGYVGEDFVYGCKLIICVIFSYFSSS